MLYKKFQMLTQIVGCVTIALLAIYGLLMILSGDSPVWVAIGRAAPLASQEIPATFNYQGFLREPDGSLATGSYTITARIYDLATDGSTLYTTTVPNVTVRDGLFNIVLGDDPPMSAEAFADVPRYIGISLNNDPELIPRQRLHAVPWALTAKTLVSNAVVDGITSTNDIVVSTGDVVVQSGQLDVTGDANVGGQLDVTGDANVGGNATVTGSMATNELILSGLPITYTEENTPTIGIDGKSPFKFLQMDLPWDHYWWYGRPGADTGVNAGEYTCAIVGFSVGTGDIQENDAGWLLAAYPYVHPDTQTWWIAAWMRTHNDFDDWRIWLMCVDNKLVEKDADYGEYGRGMP